MAKNGRDALNFIDTYCKENNALPELILIDINMPMMDGFEFIEQLKNTGFTDIYKTTLAALTTSTNPKDISRLEDLGIEYYFNKPLQKDKFLELLKK